MSLVGVEFVARARQAVVLRRGKAKRAMSETAVTKYWTEGRYRALRLRHADHLPWVPRERFDIIAELRSEGVATRRITLPSAVSQAAERYTSRLRNDASPRACLRLPATELLSEPTLFVWGLDAENLDLAEHYIGLPVHYLGMEFKRERPHGVGREDVRHWHRDLEDRRMLKIIIYFSDVDADCGPFEYVDPDDTSRLTRGLACRAALGRPTMADLAVPAGARRAVTGPRLTATYADTARVLHRIKAPTNGERYSVTFVYSSTTPYLVYPHFMPVGMSLLSIWPDLTSRQRHALIPTVPSDLGSRRPPLRTRCPRGT
jgi:hypothetical protein